MESYGMHFTGNSPSFSGPMMGREIDLSNIKEQDLYSAESYSEIIRGREEKARLKQAQETAERLARQEQMERNQYETLKLKYGEK